MRTEFTAISAFSMVIAFIAGLVLCMQLANMQTAPTLGLSQPTLWGLEAVIFGSAIYAWRRRISFSGWIAAVVGLAAVRLILTAGAGLGLAAMHGEGDVPTVIQQMSKLPPRMCAVLFSLMVWYPLRIFLPLRPVQARQPRRFADSPAVKSAAGIVVGGDSELVIWAGSEQAGSSKDSGGPAAISMLETSRPHAGLEGSVELPIRAMLAQMPQDLLTAKAQEIDDRQVVSIPLDVILPQLKEAQVVVSLAQIRQWLPDRVKKALAEQDDAIENSESVPLPLELIVPGLPAETLALPEPSPPAWAEIDQSERVVFAKV